MRIASSMKKCSRVFQPLGFAGETGGQHTSGGKPWNRHWHALASLPSMTPSQLTSALAQTPVGGLKNLGLRWACQDELDRPRSVALLRSRASCPTAGIMGKVVRLARPIRSRPTTARTPCNAVASRKRPAFPSRHSASRCSSGCITTVNLFPERITPAHGPNRQLFESRRVHT
jgi:hypothetical protein